MTVPHITLEQIVATYPRETIETCREVLSRCNKAIDEYNKANVEQDQPLISADEARKLFESGQAVEFADEGENAAAIAMLQSLPAVSGEPVAIKKHYPNIHMCSLNDGDYRCIEELQPIEPETLLYTSPQLTPITAEMVSDFENALDGGHGWWCDRDVKTIMEVALATVIKNRVTQ